MCLLNRIAAFFRKFIHWIIGKDLMTAKTLDDCFQCVEKKVFDLSHSERDRVVHLFYLGVNCEEIIGIMYHDRKCRALRMYLKMNYHMSDLEIDELFKQKHIHKIICDGHDVADLASEINKIRSQGFNPSQPAVGNSNTTGID